MNNIQKLKRNFRASKIWRNFRHEMNVKQNGRDPITGSKLGKSANLHHRHVTAGGDEYKDLSNEDDYVMLLSSTHKMLHFIYTYWKKDPSILQRIEEELKKWY